MNEVICTGNETVRSATALAVLWRALDRVQCARAKAGQAHLARVKSVVFTSNLFAMGAMESATCIS